MRFYDLLLEQESDPAFFPGNYALQKEMSAQSALDALLDPENKVTDRLLITEGTTLPNALEIISETDGDRPWRGANSFATILSTSAFPLKRSALKATSFRQPTNSTAVKTRMSCSI